MTEQEAITVLKMIETHGSLPTLAKETSIKALEKQVPMKPNGISCGSCNYVLVQNYDLYCPRCGQKVDWKGENENE